MSVTVVRSFALTQVELGVSKLDGSWFVYDRALNDPSAKWHLHCGPYSTFEQARDWITGIAETDL